MATTTKIQPVNDYLLIEPVKQQAKTASGIYIPDTADKDKPQQAKVVAAGPGKMHEGKRTPMDIAPGDTVLYTKYGPTEVKVEGVEYVFIQEHDVIALIK